MNRFSIGQLVGLLSALIILTTGCTSYKLYYVDAPEIYRSKNIKLRTDKFDFYVHDLSGRHFQALDPKIDDSVFVAVLVEVDYIDYPEKLSREDHDVKRNDIHLFPKDSLIRGKQSIELKKDDLSTAAVYSTNKSMAESDAGSGMIKYPVFVWMGAVFLMILLIWALISFINKVEQATANSENMGCYIATMAYGSYEAPEVLVLRRFRDERLMRTKGGRLFVRWYYATSPYFVRVFKNVRWVNNLVRKVLDRFVNKLKRQHGW